MQKIFLISVLLFVFLQACSEEEEPLVCSTEFKSIVIEVNGNVLEDYFTIRQINNDTIRFQGFNEAEENNYTVLDDNFTIQLSNKPAENFTFIGIIDNNVVVNEAFVITADECHIQFVSGNTSVDL